MITKKNFYSIILSLVLVFIFSTNKSCANEQFSRKLLVPDASYKFNGTYDPFQAENIILIILDDFGVEMIRPYKDDVLDIRPDLPDMPTLDHLVDNGVRFINAYSGPTCSPSRAMMYTGKYAFRTGVGCPVGARGSTELSLNETVIFKVLQERGYNTGMFGKWHLHEDDEDNTEPNQLGLDVHDGLYIGALINYYNWTNTRDGVKTNITNEYITSYQTDRALEWLDEINYEDFILVMSYISPHTPVHKPPSDLINTPEYKELEETIDVRRLDNVTDAIQYYFAMLESVDTEIGRILDALDPETREKTAIIFLGDNGTDREVAEFNENKPYTSGRTKNTVYEGGVRVPLVISGAGVTKPGSNDSNLASLVDVYATIFDLLDEKIVGDDLDSISLYPALQGDFNGRDIIYSEQFGYCFQRQTQVYFQDQQAIRNKRFKLYVIDYFDGPLVQEFYDLLNDPAERVNLLDDNGNIDPNANDRTVVHVDLDLASIVLEELKERLSSINDAILEYE